LAVFHANLHEQISNSVEFFGVHDTAHGSIIHNGWGENTNDPRNGALRAIPILCATAGTDCRLH
jgi:hypothetical protein